MPNLVPIEATLPPKPDSHLALITVKDLPSCFIPYPPDSRVAYRPYTYGEVKGFSESSKDDGVNNLQAVLKGITTSFPVLDLTMGDCLYLGLLRRLSTLGTDKYTIKAHCSHPLQGDKTCGELTSRELSSNEIDFDELEIPGLPVIAPLTHGEVEFDTYRAKHYLDLEQRSKSKDTVAILASMIRGKVFEDAYTLLSDSPVSDSAIIQEVDKTLYHGARNVEMKCPSGHVFQVSLDGGDQVFFLPFRGPQEPVARRVRFGQENGTSASPSPSS